MMIDEWLGERKWDCNALRCVALWFVGGSMMEELHRGKAVMVMMINLRCIMVRSAVR